MSQRPSTIARNKCSYPTDIDYDYVIIGDTSVATLYARRLLANGVTTNITLLSEGTDRTNVVDIQNTDFIPTTQNTIFNYLKLEKIHLVTPGDDINERNPHAAQFEQIYHYAYGSGPLGDFVSSPTIPRIGPWLENSTNTRSVRFSLNASTQMPLSKAEQELTKRLADTWGIPITNNIIVNQPSINGVHHVMVSKEDEAESYLRQLFLDEYNNINEASNITYASGFRNLAISSDNCPTGLYNVTYTIDSNTTTLSCVRVVWKTNPYTYLRLYTESTSLRKTLAIPSSYTFIASIPVVPSYSNSKDCPSHNWNNCGCSKLVHNNPLHLPCNGGYTSGIDISNETHIGDLVTTDIAFSLPDLNNKNNSSLTWVGHAYTTYENLVNTTPLGQYAPPSNVLLIVNLACYKNRRTFEYVLSQQELLGQFNNRIQERNYLLQFACISAGVYNAYTGKTLNIESLISDCSVCTPNGICNDNDIIRSYSFRQTAPSIYINTVANLYSNLETYKAAGSC